MLDQEQINKEIMANFIARMIRKYGKEVLEEIEAERKAKEVREDSPLLTE